MGTIEDILATLIPISGVLQRNIELLEAVRLYMDANPSARELEVNYDGTTCDGECLGNDCSTAYEDTSDAVARLSALIRRE